MPKLREVFYLSEGAYSDYGIACHLIALKDFSMRDASREFLSRDPGKRQQMRFWDFTKKPAVRLETPVMEEVDAEHNIEGFIAFLIREGYAEDFAAKEYYLGDYGRMTLYTGED